MYNFSVLYLNFLHPGMLCAKVDLVLERMKYVTKK